MSSDLEVADALGLAYELVQVVLHRGVAAAPELVPVLPVDGLRLARAWPADQVWRPAGRRPAPRP